jgi:hypothetical protein
METMGSQEPNMYIQYADRSAYAQAHSVPDIAFLSGPYEKQRRFASHGASPALRKKK